MAPIERDGDADVLPVEGAATAATELRCISWGGARVVSCSSGIGGNIGSETGDHRYCSLGHINKGGSRRARVVRWSGVIGRGSGGGNVDRRYCSPVASAARTARALASAAGSADDSWGVGDQPGAFAILSPKESIDAAVATSAAPHSEEFGGLRAVGTFEELRGT